MGISKMLYFFEVVSSDSQRLMSGSNTLISGVFGSSGYVTSRFYIPVHHGSEAAMIRMNVAREGQVPTGQVNFIILSGQPLPRITRSPHSEYHSYHQCVNPLATSLPRCAGRRCVNCKKQKNLAFY